jgi:hypothetical protein
MKRFALLFAVVALVATACSDSVEDATDAYCDDLSALSTALGEVSTLNASSTVDDVQNVADNISDAYDDVVSSAANVDDAVTSEIDSARSDFQSSVSSISSDASVSEALTDLQTAGQTYAAAVQSTLSKVDCSSSS